MLAILTLLASTAGASSTTINSCYSAAEAATTNRVVQVKLGETIVLSTADVDSAMDKVAELHTNATLSVSTNLSGKAALKGSMDCIFDAGLVTLSGVWLNENESALSVRTYTGVVIEDGSPTDYLTFDDMETVNGTDYIHLAGSEGNWDCAYLTATSHQTNDYFSDFTSAVPLCMNSDCSGRCNFYPELGNKCECAIAYQCSTLWTHGEAANASIMKWLDPV